jgi:hypothetical protein
MQMKQSTVRALAQTMDMRELADAQLRFTMVRQQGVTYSMGERRPARGARWGVCVGGGRRGFAGATARQCGLGPGGTGMTLAGRVGASFGGSEANVT